MQIVTLPNATKGRLREISAAMKEIRAEGKNLPENMTPRRVAIMEGRGWIVDLYTGTAAQLDEGPWVRIDWGLLTRNA